MKYTISEYCNHMQQSLDDSMKWHEALKHFETDKERRAVKAGFEQGARDSRGRISLHGGFKLFDAVLNKHVG